MNRCIALIFALAGTVLAAQSTTPAGADQAAIRSIVNHWREAWDKLDVSPMKDDYASDADWHNAFGVKQKGSANILAFVQNVLKRPTSHGRRTEWDEPEIRFLRPDVAVAYRDYRTVGHKTPDGKEMPQRNTHATWVLRKDSGTWRIVSHTIADDNDAAQPANGSGR